VDVVVDLRAPDAREDGVSDVGAENPYDWTLPKAPITIERSSVDSAVELLLAGRGALLLAGRGLGKSRFVTDVKERLERDRSVKVLRYREPPAFEHSLSATLRKVTRDLGVDVREVESFDVVLRMFFEANEGYDRVCLLFDEVDQYAVPDGGEPLGRRLFNHLESCRQELDGRLGILAVGGVGAYHLRSANASPFTARAKRLWLSPFTVDEIRQLARPFLTDGRPLDDDVILALFNASGGNPALVTFGLQSVWHRAAVCVSDIVDAFGRFAEVHSDFVDAFRRSAMSRDFSVAPELVFRAIARAGGTIPWASLIAQCPSDLDAAAFVSLDDTLDILACAGLIAITGSSRSDPVVARPIQSVLTLPMHVARSAPTSLQAQLVTDLERLLVHMHTVSPDFFHGKKGEAKQIVPEAVFCATLAIALRQMGCTVEREATHGAGRTDLKASHPVFADEYAIVELKIWPRNDYEKIHSQVESYWSRDVTAAACVMISDRDAGGWADEYIAKCLADGRLTVTPSVPQPPIVGSFDVRSTTPDGVPAVVRHELLRLARR
jgi:hypothetical protein